MKKLKRTLLGVGGIVFAVVLAFAGGAVSGGDLLAGLMKERDITTETESSTSQIVTALEGQEQVILLSASIQGLHEEKAEATTGRWRIPRSGRTTVIQYSYRAQFGIEGQDVQIEQISADEYSVSVPEFRFLGHSDTNFKTGYVDNSVLSFLTEEIDIAETVTKVLNDETKDQQIEENRDLLESQARSFYTGIVKGIDPEVQLVFEFRDRA